ncbi:Mini-ribonuclease 3 [Alicyclobacillus kakegawensis]|uniref:Mini-ribonuclease 3 n=1 Tax=Alicyclobacillus kakegawensis TaxID=392012 RepID=UPI0008367BC6|nr:ribonuclease III domain-containing protein [Alicyclobacillus kakegawensis]
MNADVPWQELSPLALAYLGDAVWELMVRQHVMGRGRRKPDDLHKAAVRYVRADTQARLAEALWPELTDMEQSFLRRGRNAKAGHVRKSADALSYRHSTGFESLLGYLYASGQDERLHAVCERALALTDEWEVE